MRKQAKAAELAAEKVASRDRQIVGMVNKEISSKKKKEAKMASAAIKAREEVAHSPTIAKAVSRQVQLQEAAPPLHGLSDNFIQHPHEQEAAKQEIRETEPFHYDLMEAEAQAEQKQDIVPNRKNRQKQHSHSTAEHPPTHHKKSHVISNKKQAKTPAKKDGGVSCLRAGACDPSICLCKKGQPPRPLQKQPTDLKESNDHIDDKLVLPAKGAKLTKLETQLILKLSKQVRNGQHKVPLHAHVKR